MTAQSVCPRCGSPRTAIDARFCPICGARWMPADMPQDPLLGAVLLGRYRVLDLLGEGSMGRVYLGEQRVGEGSRRVAIKVLASPREHDAYVIARFRREAATIASLDHPNVIRIYDYGEEDGRFISVMEYVPGGSLGDLLAKGPLEPGRAERIGWQIAEGLEEAHRRGVVHRDLKPENVLIARAADGRDVVKVVDFGIARRLPVTASEKPLTATGTMIGTPAYMAPEQYMGAPADARVDVYALALVVYQMLAGRPPWAAETVMEWAEAHLHRPPMPLTAQAGCTGLPSRYDDALAHGLAKNPADRTSSARALMRELTGAPEEHPGVTGDSGRGESHAEGTMSAATVSPRVYLPTVEGQPVGRSRSRPWLGLAVFALGSAVFGYAVVTGVRVLWNGSPGTTSQVAVDGAALAGIGSPPDGPAEGSGDGARGVPWGAPGGVPGGVPWGVPGVTSGVTASGARAMASVQAGLAAARQGRFNAAVTALEQAHTGGALTPAEIEPLRAAVESLGAREVARVLPTSCSRAQDAARRLGRVGASAQAMRGFTRRCRPPT